jgi:preprotein translocase subunit SecF
MFVIKYRKVFYAISGLLVAFSIFSVAFWGLNAGIDFKGGAVLEAEFKDSNSPVEEIKNSISGLDFGETSVRPIGDKGIIIKTKSLSEEERKSLIKSLDSLNKEYSVTKFDSVGPTLGKELQSKAVVSIILVILAIVLFIAFAFRHVSEPVSSWKYGFVAIIALIHDVIIPTGFFAFLGRNGGYEIDGLFITALLVVLGFSVHDTIVVFDRTRENLKNLHEKNIKKPFEEVVGGAVSQTFTRSINTSLTTIIALIVLFLFGPESIHNFSLALIIGIVAGTYSSIFLGSTLLVTLEKRRAKKAENLSQKV